MMALASLATVVVPTSGPILTQQPQGQKAYKGEPGNQRSWGPEAVSKDACAVLKGSQPEADGEAISRTWIASLRPQ